MRFILKLVRGSVWYWPTRDFSCFPTHNNTQLHTPTHSLRENCTGGSVRGYLGPWAEKSGPAWSPTSTKVCLTVFYTMVCLKVCSDYSLICVWLMKICICLSSKSRYQPFQDGILYCILLFLFDGCAIITNLNLFTQKQRHCRLSLHCQGCGTFLNCCNNHAMVKVTQKASTCKASFYWFTICWFYTSRLKLDVYLKGWGNKEVHSHSSQNCFNATGMISRCSSWSFMNFETKNLSNLVSVSQTCLILPNFAVQLQMEQALQVSGSQQQQQKQRRWWLLLLVCSPSPW